MSITSASTTTRDANEELYESILGEIAERKEFLSRMNALGQGKQHEAQINAEIKEVFICLRSSFCCLCVPTSESASDAI
jgi:hypothetical protein